VAPVHRGSPVLVLSQVVGASYEDE